MLEALMKFGGYRIERFAKSVGSGEEFGFYIRPQIGSKGDFFAAAKSQFYYGLAMIDLHNEMDHLAGIYVDIDDLENLQRPAYQAMKLDLEAGLFHKVMILEREALLGCVTAEVELFGLSKDISGLELFRFQAGEREVFPLFAEMMVELYG
jgi:hypothetical protein